MIPGVDPTTVAVVIWGLAALVLSWTWFPAIISSLGGTRYSTGGDNDIGRIEAAMREPGFAFWAKQLEALGYEPLGSGWLRVNFAGPQWVLLSALAVFENPAKSTYAYMEKAPAPYSFWPGAEFATCFADGGALFTDNNTALQPDPGEERIRQGIVTLKLEEVEALHRATLEALRRMNRKADPELNMEMLLQTLQRYEGPEARRAHSRAGTNFLFAHGLIHICVSIPTAYLLGLAHWAVPMSNLVLGLVMALGESSQKRQYAQAVRAGLRKQI